MMESKGKIYKGYSEEEVSFIRENYETMTYKQMGETIGKNPSSVRYVAISLGLIKQKHKDWTEEEREFIRDNYGAMLVKDIAKHLDKTIHSVNSEVDRMELYKDKPWSEEELEYLKNNYLSEEHKEIAKRFGRSTCTITAKCHDLGLRKKESPWSEEEIEYVRNNYQDLPTREIAAYLNRSMSAVQLKGKRLGLKKSPYSCDYHYFGNINTEEKAYWLGFFAADGWISKNEKSGAGAFGIELQYGDMGHLKKFNKSIHGNYNINDRWRSCSLSSHKEKKNHMCLIRIFSRIMYDDLVSLGYTENKTFESHIPELNSELVRHFVRGYFDGNGCFSVSNNRICVGFITASKTMAENLRSVLNDEGILIHIYTYKTENDVTMYRLELTSNCNKFRFLEYIYSESSIFLDRKYKKYKKAKAMFL